MSEFRAGFEQAFDYEDKPIIELVATQMETTDLFSIKPVFLRSNAGAVLARRALANMIADERRSRFEEGRVDDLESATVQVC